MHLIQSRRNFLTTLSVAGAAGVFGGRTSLADEPPPEVTTIHLLRDPTCGAPTPGFYFICNANHAS